MSEMYIGHARLCVCVPLYVPCRISTLLHGPGCKFGNGRGCSLVVLCWADLQSVHAFRCYDNIAPNAKCPRVLVLALRLVVFNIQLTYLRKQNSKRKRRSRFVSFNLLFV